jgi:protein-S-isoprenylcysteine O-methyltransferase Ste14
MSTASLTTRARRSLLRSLAVQGAVLFLCAGSFGYGRAWLYLAFTAVSTLATNAYLMRSNRGLLDRRLAAEEHGETERVQKLFFLLLRIVGLVMLTVAGLDRRFGWSSVSPWTAACAYLALCMGAVLVVLVFRENAHGSSVIEVTAEQRVVASGPYRWVRHPMYTGFLLMIGATPLALGSLYAQLVVPPIVGLFVMRLLAEERFLAAHLSGYASYLNTTQKRLLPWVW